MGDMPRSEVAAVNRALVVPKARHHSQLQYDRQGDTVTALMGPPERPSLILPREEVVGRRKRRTSLDPEKREWSASSVSAPVRTAESGGGVTGSRDRKPASVSLIASTYCSMRATSPCSSRNGEAVVWTTDNGYCGRHLLALHESQLQPIRVVTV